MPLINVSSKELFQNKTNFYIEYNANKLEDMNYVTKDNNPIVYTDMNSGQFKIKDGADAIMKRWNILQNLIKEKNYSIPLKMTD